MSKKQRHHSGSRPIIRVRSMLLGIIVIAAVITGPLLLVWKQVYLTSASLKIEKMTDSLTVLSREITALHLKCERLSSKERIERIAQTSLGLDHPSADRIVILKIPGAAGGDKPGWPHEFAAFLKKSLRGERG